MQEKIEQLEKLRNRFRTLMMVCLAVELVAVVLIFLGRQVPGLVVGIASMASYFYVKRVGKRCYGEACARIQIENTLGLSELVYEGRVPFDGTVLHKTGMVSSALKIDSTTMQHALRGRYDGQEVALGEITFGVAYHGQNKHEFNTGVLLTAPLTNAPEKPVLLLGHESVRHKLIRKEYEDDGWKLCNVGGKARGWFLLTPDGYAPDAALLDKLDALSQAAEGKVLLSMKDGQLTAFFLGNFYTGEYPMGEKPEAQELRKQLFPHLRAALALTK